MRAQLTAAKKNSRLRLTQNEIVLGINVARNEASSE